MKKIIAIVALCFLGLGVAQAQVSVQKSPINSTLQTGVVDMLTQKLNLSAKQITSVTRITELFAGLRKKINESTHEGFTPDLKAKRIKSLNDREDSNMKKILNETQYTQFLELAKDIRKG